MAQLATGLSRLIASRHKRRYAAVFKDGTLHELRRNRFGEWEVPRPDEGPGIVCSYSALWKAKHSLRAAGIGFIVLK
jgi:hypothetical protein